MEYGDGDTILIENVKQFLGDQSFAQGYRFLVKTYGTIRVFLERMGDQWTVCTSTDTVLFDGWLTDVIQENRKFDKKNLTPLQ